jgi:hypothetical protein
VSLNPAPSSHPILGTALLQPLGEEELGRGRNQKPLRGALHRVALGMEDPLEPHTPVFQIRRKNRSRNQTTIEVMQYLCRR